MADLLVTQDSSSPQESWGATAPARHWWQADASQLYLRMSQLEGELAVAAALLELREVNAEARGERRSHIATGLIAKWRQLIAAKPTGGAS